jgi:hypothetical protein
VSYALRVSAKVNTTAIVALGAAVLGYTCLLGMGGLLAVVLGIVALKEIERSEGRETGRGLSITAISLGGLSLAGLVVAFGVGIAFIARPDPPGPPPVAAKPPARRAPRLPSPASTELTPAPEVPLAPRGELKETVLGHVRLVDPGAGVLSALLESQRKEAATSGEKLVIFVVAPDCTPCNGVMDALKDTRMQHALERVRLVRVDASQRAGELSDLGVPVDSVPGFALLGRTLHPVDYVHGGEWDADIPENIAPVLGAFVRGKYLRRRHPFRRPHRPDDTAL